MLGIWFQGLRAARRPGADGLKALLLASVAVGLSAAVSGCGDTRPPEEKWAAEVCSAIVRSQEQMRDALIRPIEDLHPGPGPDTRVTVSRTITDTQALVDELAVTVEGLEPPTATTREAQEDLVRDLRAFSEGFLATARTEFDEDFRELLPELTARENAGILGRFEVILRNAKRQLAAFVGIMLGFDPSLVDAFRAADECGELQSDPDPG